MTRLFTDGGEFGDVLFFDLPTGASIQTDHVRSGVYAYAKPSATGAEPAKLFAPFPDLSEFYFRYNFYLTAGGSDWWPLVMFQNNGTNVVQLWMDTDYKLHLYVGGSSVATGIYSMLNNTWHLIDMHIAIGTSGSLQCKADGIMDCEYFGDTRGGSQTVCDRFAFGAGWHLGFYPSQYFDDIALNDTNGDEDNSWCGDGHVERLSPNGEGDTLEWTPSSGSVHYQMVDDFPPDGDATFVGTILPNKRDMYNLSSFDDTNKLVRRIFTEMRARDMSAVGQQLRLGFQTSGSVFLSPLRTLSYNYSAIRGEEHIINPMTGQPWTKTDLDALQFVLNSEDIIG